jgi:hypothetical protein
MWTKPEKLVKTLSVRLTQSEYDFLKDKENMNDYLRYLLQASMQKPNDAAKVMIRTELRRLLNIGDLNSPTFSSTSEPSLAIDIEQKKEIREEDEKANRGIKSMMDFQGS